MSELPPWSSLPVDPSHPPGSCWIWGQQDELGRFNLLTPSRVAAAAKLIETGDRVSLNWSLDRPKYAAFGRRSLEHRIIKAVPGIVNDDEISFNTQCGSQIDGYFHYAYHKSKLFYNGRTQEDVDQRRCQDVAAWAKAGIAGTGVFLDYYAWALANDESYDPLSSHSIPLSSLRRAISSQNLHVRLGDTLLIRFGFIEACEQTDDETLRRLAGEGTFVGLEQSDEMVEFLYGLGAVIYGSDAPAFERWPPKKFAMHQYILAGWGASIGELMDLEALAATCKRLNRNSFFFSSQPLSIPGGIASPPSAMAIF